VARPARSTAEPTPVDQPISSLTPDRRGRYVVRFTATDTELQTASCEVVVQATPAPPVAICPERIETTPLSMVAVTGMADVDVDVASYGWALTRTPVGSSADPPSPMNEATTGFTPDLAGDYLLTFSFVDVTAAPHPA